MRVLCVATQKQLPRVHVLRRSLMRHAPGWSLEVACFGPQPQHDDEVHLTSIEDELDIEVAPLVEQHGIDLVAGLLTPALLQARIDQDGEPWLHLPASVWVWGSLAPLEEKVVRGGVMLASRANLYPSSDGLEPSREQLERAGRFALDVLGVDASAKAHEFLRWWRGHLDDAFGTLGRPRPVTVENRIWVNSLLELAPVRFNAAVLDDPGANLSFWNLHEHRVADREGRITVDGSSPLRFLNMEGYEPDKPHRLNAKSSRIRLSREPVLKRLSLRYRQELIDAGWQEAKEGLGLGDTFGHDLTFDETMASLLEAARLADPRFVGLTSEQDRDAFIAWMREPPWPGAEDGVGRYTFQRVLRDRPDVLAAYPDLQGDDYAEFASWCRSFGFRELDIPEELIPNEAADDTVTARDVVTTSEDHAAQRPPAPASEPRQVPGVRVSGYLGHVLGLGAAARGYARALSVAEVPVTTATVALDHVDVGRVNSVDYGRHSYAGLAGGDNHGFELICVNADELPQFVGRLGPENLRGHRIGVWGWETNTIPARWADAFALLDEIWVYSRFMADNIGRVAPVPVTALPPPVEPPQESMSPLRLGVPDGFLFLFVFDYLSTIQRKNPIGLIQAFKRAFRPNEGPQLLIKTINGPLRPLVEEEVLWAVDDRPDIHVIDRSLTSEDRDALMMACDCYVSLHRSEGFGLTMAEAMAIGKPVIGTGYSGNVDFMDADNSLLVDYKITRVGPGCEIYPANGEWAEPNLEHAGELMRGVWRDPGLAHRLGAQAREDIARTLSPKATGAAMRRRLEELAKGSKGGRGSS